MFDVRTVRVPKTTGAIRAYFIFVNIAGLLLSYCEQRGERCSFAREMRPARRFDNRAHYEKVILATRTI
jgi:hypothetical protein